MFYMFKNIVLRLLQSLFAFSIGIGHWQSMASSKCWLIRNGKSGCGELALMISTLHYLIFFSWVLGRRGV